MLTSSSSSPSLSAQSPSNYSARGYRVSPSSTFGTPQNLTTSSRRITPPRSDHPLNAAPLAGSHPDKTVTVDVGTQYTPPDWPPTDSRSSLHGAAHRSRPTTTDQSEKSTTLHPDRVKVLSPTHTITAAPVPQPSVPVDPPTEPRVRVTPQTSLHHVARKGYAEDSSSRSATGSPSASKRARYAKAGREIKMMPADYATCDPKTLAGIIAEMLMRLINCNDDIPLKDGQLTRFHSRAPPGISVHDYLARLTFHATLSPPILLSMVFFIDRLSEYFSTFIVNSLTIHRFLITAATVASKGLSDSFWTNQTYARVGGVSVKELALLELELLQKCDWRIVPSPEQLVEYYKGVVEQSEDWVLEGADETDPSLDSSDLDSSEYEGDRRDDTLTEPGDKAK